MAFHELLRCFCIDVWRIYFCCQTYPPKSNIRKIWLSNIEIHAGLWAHISVFTKCDAKSWFCHITLPTIGHLIYLTEILEKEAGFTSLYRNHNDVIPVKIVVLHYVYNSTLRWKCFGQTYYAFCIQWPGNIVKTMDQSFYFIPFVYKWLILVIYPNFISRSCLKSFEETVGWHKIGN